MQGIKKFLVFIASAAGTYILGIALFIAAITLYCSTKNDCVGIGMVLGIPFAGGVLPVISLVIGYYAVKRMSAEENSPRSPQNILVVGIAVMFLVLAYALVGQSLWMVITLFIIAILAIIIATKKRGESPVITTT